MRYRQIRWQWASVTVTAFVVLNLRSSNCHTVSRTALSQDSSGHLSDESALQPHSGLDKTAVGPFSILYKNRMDSKETSNYEHGKGLDSYIDAKGEVIGDKPGTHLDSKMNVRLVSHNNKDTKEKLNYGKPSKKLNSRINEHLVSRKGKSNGELIGEGVLEENVDFEDRDITTAIGNFLSSVAGKFGTLVTNFEHALYNGQYQVIIENAFGKFEKVVKGFQTELDDKRVPWKQTVRDSMNAGRRMQPHFIPNRNPLTILQRFGLGNLPPSRERWPNFSKRSRKRRAFA